MFRKIVSNLSFSPALVGQLGFYAKRLRKEEATRRIGLIFVALALVVQCLAVFQPPQSANAIAAADLVSGGLGIGPTRSFNKFLVPYDANTGHLRDIYNYAGITRQEIVDTQYSSFLTKKSQLDWGRVPSAGDSAITITNTTGTAKIMTVYAGPITTLNGTGTRIYAWVGHSAKVGWFAIMQACGNLVLTVTPTPPTPPAPPTPPPPTPPTPPKPPTPPPLPANVIQSKTAMNMTQGRVDAATTTANAGDLITYTITVKNEGGVAALTKLSDYLGDVLQYSTLVDNGGGALDSTTNYLTWTDINLAPGETQARTFSVQLLSTIPATAQGQTDPSSYDCRMQNTFGANVTVTIAVACPAPKAVEQVVTQLPHTGPTENLIFAGVVLAVVTYFYARARQVGKEVRLIRRDLNSGTI
ncbi:MAG: hypothetical protein JWN26_4 [Candidatus Saccharibacteria bacterium]|nr:hypothetical protein [Candidatus Saccharibacteria bacterium]